MNKSIIFIFLFLPILSCVDQKGDIKGNPEIELPTTSAFKSNFFIGKDFMIDNQHSYIGFKIKYFGYSPVRGRFDDFNGTIFYDESDITSLAVSIFIEVNSINTGNEQRDNDLKSEGTWFDAKKHPTIYFQSKNVIVKSEGVFDLIGYLTIKGVKKEVTVSFNKPTSISRDWAGNEQVDFSGKLVINRQDFGVFGGDFWSSIMENGVTQLSDEVEIEIDIHTRRANYQTRYNDADTNDLDKLVLDEIKTNGYEKGENLIDSLFLAGELTAGKFSSIGNTLNSWEMHQEALSVFKKREYCFPEKINTNNQIGVTHLYLDNVVEAEQEFKTTLSKDSINSMATEYLRLISKINKND